MTIRIVGTEQEEAERTEKLRRSQVECSFCHILRQWGGPCPHCHKFIGSIEEAGEFLIQSIQRLTPEEQEEFRRETMRRVRHELAKTAWEKDNAGRPYDSEFRN